MILIFIGLSLLFSAAAKKLVGEGFDVVQIGIGGDWTVQRSFYLVNSNLFAKLLRYFFLGFFMSSRAACAAARRAMGTRNGEQLT
jgi:hypothetical protein